MDLTVVAGLGIASRQRQQMLSSLARVRESMFDDLNAAGFNKFNVLILVLILDSAMTLTVIMRGS